MMPTFDRRHLLFAGTGLSGMALARAAGSQARLELRDPRSALEAYVKLRGSTADETVFQVYEGDIFQAADGTVGIPLCGFRGIQKSTWRREGSAYTHTDFDLGFYVDYRSREILKTWLNPLTGRTVEVFHYRGGPSGGRLAEHGADADVYGGLEGRWTVVGDQLWHTSSNWSERTNPMTPEEWPLASSGRLLRGSMSLTYSGRVSEILDPSLHRPRTLQLWTNSADWMPWMEMGQRPGFNLWRWIGAKGAGRSELPADLVAAAEQSWPGYVSRDSAWTVPTSGRLDYMRAKRGLTRTD